MCLRGDNMRKKFTTTIDSEVLQAIKIQAVKENTDVSKLIEKLMVEYLNEHKNK